MKRLLQIFIVVLAFAWVPMTSHCAWENIPGLEFFKCADDAKQSSSTASHNSQKNDCKDDACATLESGLYKVSDTQMAVPVPSFAILIQLSLLEIASAEQSSPVTVAPPEIPVSWKFFSRTALPPRAPSLA